MAGHIYKKTIRGNDYYYYQESHRKKIGKSLEKTKGSGKSSVKTKSIYLGSAEDIFLRIKNNHNIPVTINHRAFGLVAAAYQTAIQAGIIDILKKHITGERYGISRWIFFLISIINRLDNAASKNKIGDWAIKTVLPDLLKIDAEKLTSKNYWYVTDDVISEEKTRKNRKKDEEDVFAGLDDKVFIDIEKELFVTLRPYFCDNSDDALIFDTSNFFTFFESNHSSLAETGHNKEGRHNLKQVGLAMTIDRNAGIPFMHRVYRGNRHDSFVFSKVIENLINDAKSSFPNIKDLVLVLDKGNNSEENFKMLDGKIEWVGSLPPSQHQDLLDIEIDKYSNIDNYKTFSVKKNVMEKECLLVMTHSDALAKKQEYTLQNSIAKLSAKLQEKYSAYKKKPIAITKGLESILNDSRLKVFINLVIENEELKIEQNNDAFLKRRKTFGKNLLFTSKINASIEWVIAQYKDRNDIEDVFRTLKDVELIRIRPLRHFTDSKIRAHIFCCVMSFLLIRLMQQKAYAANLKMSHTVLKEELSDLKQIIMVYENKNAEIKISQPSTIQQKLYNLFQLEKTESLLTLHNC